MLYFFIEVHIENQINVGDQNTQQIGNNSVVQSEIPEKPKISYLVIVAVVLVCFVVFGFSGYYFGKQSNLTQNTAPKNYQVPTSVPTTTRQPTNSIIKSTLQYEISLPKDWETSYEKNKETSRVMTSLDDSRLSNIAFYRNHKPKTNEADKDVVNGYGSLYDLSLVEVVFAVAKLEDKYQTWQDVLNEENKLYDDQQNRLSIMKSTGEDPCGPWWQDIKPQTLSIGDYIALSLPYKAFCQYESPIPSEYHGVWKIFPSSSSKEYIFIEYSYSQNNQTASESVKQLESAIKSIKIIVNKN